MIENGLVLKSRRPKIGKPYVKLLTSRLKATDLREKRSLSVSLGCNISYYPFSVSLYKFYKSTHFSYYVHS